MIELIVVIAILGILALIAIPRFAGIRERAEIQSVETTATTILNAAETQYVETGVDELVIADLVTAEYLRDSSVVGGAGDYDNYTIAGADGVYTVTFAEAGHPANGLVVGD